MDSRAIGDGEIRGPLGVEAQGSIRRAAPGPVVELGNEEIAARDGAHTVDGVIVRRKRGIRAIAASRAIWALQHAVEAQRYRCRRSLGPGCTDRVCRFEDDGRVERGPIRVVVANAIDLKLDLVTRIDLCVGIEGVGVCVAARHVCGTTRQSASLGRTR